MIVPNLSKAFENELDLASPVMISNRMPPYRDSDRVEAVFHEPLPICIADPGVPLPFKYLLSILRGSNLVLGNI